MSNNTSSPGPRLTESQFPALPSPEAKSTTDPSTELAAFIALLRTKPIGYLLTKEEGALLQNFKIEPSSFAGDVVVVPNGSKETEEVFVIERRKKGQEQEWTKVDGDRVVKAMRRKEEKRKDDEWDMSTSSDEGGNNAPF